MYVFQYAYATASIYPTSLMAVCERFGDVVAGSLHAMHPDSGDDVLTASLPLSRFRVRARGIEKPPNHHLLSSTDILQPRLDGSLSLPDRHSLEALATPAGTVCRQISPHIQQRIASTVAHAKYTRIYKHASHEHAVGASHVGRTALRGVCRGAHCGPAA
jgi:hypothetical protein